MTQLNENRLFLHLKPIRVSVFVPYRVVVAEGVEQVEAVQEGLLAQNNIGEETDGGESDGGDLPADESSNALASLSSNTVVAPTSATSGRPTDSIAPEKEQARAREELNGANRNAPSIYHDVNGNGLFKIYESNWSFLVKNELNKYDA